MHVKIFKSHINETTDTNSIEYQVNSFVKGKNVVAIEQSVVRRETEREASPIRAQGPTAPLYFIVITVLYEEKM